MAVHRRDNPPYACGEGDRRASCHGARRRRGACCACHGGCRLVGRRCQGGGGARAHARAAKDSSGRGEQQRRGHRGAGTRTCGHGSGSGASPSRGGRVLRGLGQCAAHLGGLALRVCRGGGAQNRVDVAAREGLNQRQARCEHVRLVGLDGRLQSAQQPGAAAGECGREQQQGQGAQEEGAAAASGSLRAPVPLLLLSSAEHRWSEQPAQEALPRLSSRDAARRLPHRPRARRAAAHVVPARPLLGSSRHLVGVLGDGRRQRRPVAACWRGQEGRLARGSIVGGVGGDGDRSRREQDHVGRQRRRVPTRVPGRQIAAASLSVAAAATAIAVSLAALRASAAAAAAEAAALALPSPTTAILISALSTALSVAVAVAVTSAILAVASATAITTSRVAARPTASASTSPAQAAVTAAARATAAFAAAAALAAGCRLECLSCDMWIGF